MLRIAKVKKVCYVPLCFIMCLPNSNSWTEKETRILRLIIRNNNPNNHLEITAQFIHLVIFGNCDDENVFA